MIEGLIALCSGQVEKFVMNSNENPDRQSYVKTIYLINNLSNKHNKNKTELTFGKDFENGNPNLTGEFSLTDTFPKYEMIQFIKSLEKLKESMIG